MKSYKKQIIIGIDGNEANIEERVGVHQYAYEILWAIYNLRKNQPINYRFIIYLKERPKIFLPLKNTWWKYKILPGKRFWIIKNLMLELLIRRRPDVFFSPSHYLPPFSFTPQVCTIHDLGYLNFSGQFKKYDFWQLKYWTAISIIVSKYIIAVSNSTRNDIVRHYVSASKKVFVSYHGYDSKRFHSKISYNDVRRMKTKYGIYKDYILFLSTLKPSKNIEGVLKGFNLLKKKGYDYQLVVAGKKGWLYKSIFEIVKNLGLDKHVVFTDYISEKDKPALLAGAKVFVSPSFWEGFGIHVLEALACGTPVVISKIASFPEVAGEAGIYVDPYDKEDICLGLENVLKMSSSEYNRLVKKGLKQVKIFTWEKCAKETLSVLEKAVVSKI